MDLEPSSEAAASACLNYLEQILGDDASYDKAWPLMDENLRLCRAQAWLWNNRDDSWIAGHLDEAAEQLVRGPAAGVGRWEAFAYWELRMVREAWLSSYERGLRPLSHARLLGPDLEVVVLVPTDEILELTPGVPQAIKGLKRFTMRLAEDGEWLVASWADLLPTPGWPPALPDYSQEPI